MPNVAIIQARMGSSRLPGKALADLAGEPLLARVVERTKAIRGIDRVVLATTTNPADEVLLAFARSQGIFAYAGSEHDVLDRYYQAAEIVGSTLVMRITGDCPLLDPEVSSRVLARFLEGDVDFVSNVMPPTFPDGLDTEVVSFSVLRRAWVEATLKSDREHVTPYVWRNKTIFRQANVASPRDLSPHRWTVDSPDDLEFARRVFAALGDSKKHSHEDVLAVLERQPELRNINALHHRNEGYQESLREDGVVTK